jgi:hypothetical protein
MRKREPRARWQGWNILIEIYWRYHIVTWAAEKQMMTIALPTNWTESRCNRAVETLMGMGYLESPAGGVRPTEKAKAWFIKKKYPL